MKLPIRLCTHIHTHMLNNYAKLKTWFRRLLRRYRPIRPGNGSGLFYSSRDPHGAKRQNVLLHDTVLYRRYRAHRKNRENIDTVPLLTVPTVTIQSTNYTIISHRKHTLTEIFLGLLKTARMIFRHKR